MVTLEIANPFTYTGRRLDSETGLYYYRNRYYDAQLGRFISRDPIGYGGSEWNLYEYARSSPVVHADPSGMILAGVCGLPGRPDCKPPTPEETYIFCRPNCLQCWGNVPIGWWTEVKSRKTKCESNDDVCKAVREAAEKSPGGCIDDLVVAGHGAKGGCQMAPGNDAFRFEDLTSEQLACISEAICTKGRLILCSCNNESGGKFACPHAKNMAKKLKREVCWCPSGTSALVNREGCSCRGPWQCEPAE